MSITSTVFLFCFLPIALIMNYFFRKNIGEYILVVLSLLFYACGSLEYLIVFMAAAIFTIALGRILNRLDRSEKAGRITLLIIGIAANASLLCFFKFSDGYLLPLGISFYTFKAISYLADIYNGKIVLTGVPVIHDALYLSFFAQIQSGPLSRYEELKQDFSLSRFSEGSFRFLIGFSKKILIADILSKITTEIFTSDMNEMTISYAWLGAIAYSLELLFDFAGYSDMAIGLTKMFGYDCRENFVYPYMTESVSKFWRRWHITLSEWFRDYIYIPLGGSRVKNKWRIYLNLLIVWLLTGIWHGITPNFILWGVGYFVMIALERLTGLPDRIQSPFGKIIYRIFTLIYIVLEWVIFKTENIRDGFNYIKHMFVPASNRLTDLRTLFLLKEYGVFLAVAVILCFPIYPFLKKKISAVNTAAFIIAAVTFILALSFVIAGLNNPFAYANF